jgi:TatD DNase family protein
MPEYIDNHCHANFPVYEADREEVIARALEAKTFLINVGTHKATSQEVVDLAQKYEQGVYAIVGLHPVSEEVFDYDFYKNLAQSKKVVGIGECGFDFFRSTSLAINRETQEKVFRAQLDLATELKKPVMLHIRQAYKEALDVLKEYKSRGVEIKGNAHFFAGSIEEAREFLDLGFTISFTGVITFTKDYDELVKFVPLDRILSETDAPYVTPVPHRGKRNEPVFVSEIVHKIAEIRGEPVDNVRKALVTNSFKLFDLITSL